MPLQVSALRVYPIKSCRPMMPNRWSVEKRGLQHDRRWMLTDADGKFRTRREMQALAQISAAIEDDRLILSKDGMEGLCAPLHPKGKSMNVLIWKTETTGQIVSAAADVWATEAVGEPSHLVYMPDSAKREVNPMFNAGDDIVGFADAYPILVLSEESVEDLNSRLDAPITFQRFRPNIIVKGAKPYDEDSWTRLQIGDVILRAARPDIRCLVTTQDPLTGEVLGPEPLRTLATYRKVEGGVIFGMYYIPEKLGNIAVGDAAQPS